MSTVELSNDQWSKILEFLRSCPNLYVGRDDDCRRFVEAMLWMARSGAPGDCCLSATGTGTASTNALPAGVIRAYGNECISILCKTLIWSTSSLIALWSVPTPAPQEPRKKRWSSLPSLGPESRRIQHQNPHKRRCFG